MILRPVLLPSLIIMLFLQASLGNIIPENSASPDSKDSSGSIELPSQGNITLSATNCQLIVDKFSNLTADLDFPRELEETNAEIVKNSQYFDINQYFIVLDRLFMEPGYILDYVYFSEGIGGQPIIYARKIDQPAYKNYTQFSAKNNISLPLEERDYLNHIQMDGTPESFFQLALLRIQGGQFYLFWHANYDDYRVICDSSRAGDYLRPLISGTNSASDQKIEKLIAQASQMDFSPVVEANDDTVRVHVVIFTKWGGFVLKTFAVSKEFPHTMQKEDDQVLIPYDCGIMF